MSHPVCISWLKLAAGLALLALLAGACKKAEESVTPVTPPTTNPAAAGQVTTWLTTADKSALFYRQRQRLTFETATSPDPTIVVDTTQTFQTMDGFGYTLTGGSAQVMSRMSAPARAALIKELFATDSTSLGVSYLRLSIGASDLNDQVYTYDDSATPDPTLANFSIAPDRAYVLPVLKEILAVNPSIKLMGSPWTAPVWMKSPRPGASAASSIGGSLLPQYYDAYARYFVKYIQAMKAEGITLDAVTLQNEPLYDGNNPSMLMPAAEQAAFIKNNVGPAFRQAGITTKIIAYDHNPDAAGLQFVNTVLSDGAASAFIDGSAFHLYGGSIDALTTVHNAFPAKNVYFTEQYTRTPGDFPNDLRSHLRDLEIGAPRNWSRNVLHWNLASDQSYGPYTPGGCSVCLGAVTISGDQVTRNPAYYSVAHASKFVRPGSVRVATNVPTDLPNVAYKTPAGKRVLVVLNNSSAIKSFNIQYKGKLLSTALYGGSVATYVW